jgi:hypothetical protein
MPVTSRRATRVDRRKSLMNPKVLSEMATMRRVAETGCNLARAGRCELKLALGRPGLAQTTDPGLQKRLRKILKAGDERVLVCLPRVFEGFPDANKEKYYAEFLAPGIVYDLFARGSSVYGSTFVSRRDGWIEDMDEAAYWPLVRGIWQDRPVLLVAGSPKGKKATGFLDNAASVDTLDCPERDAWGFYEGVLADCLAWARPKKRPLIYAALGATAAVLCAELATHGVQALDLGHMWQSWAKRA